MKPTALTPLAALLATTQATLWRAPQVLAAPLQARKATLWDTRPDTWAAIDGLGRVVPAQGQSFAGAPVPAPRKDRFVGLFYFLWLGEHGSQGPFDISKILARDSNAMQKPDSPLWGPLAAPHHWGEPRFGYYVSDDEWVLRKHAQMLVDAGVDTVIFDVTNQLTYPRSYNALCRTFARIRREGGRTPSIAFLAPFWDPARVVRSLYENLYRPGLYDDLFFRWEGKPLIMADPALVTPQSMTLSVREPTRLELGSTLGQALRAARPFSFVGGNFPTWSAPGSAVTVSLFDKAGGKLLARQRITNLRDNALSGIELKNPLPAGSYYFEISQPAGSVGWWTAAGSPSDLGAAYAEGAPVTAQRDLSVRYAGEGKPTPLTSSEASTGDAASAQQRSKYLAEEIGRYFTFRKPQPSYFEGPTGPSQWGWLEVAPQHLFTKAPGVPEQMVVGVAQNAVDGKLSMLSNPRSHGRSFHDGQEPPLGERDFTGRNAIEQWQRALAVDPPFVFVTGWNEWIAGRFPKEPNPFYDPGPVNFVDQFDPEFSRDIEPMRGGHGDAYYLQLASYLRRYKGARAPEVAGPPRSIKIDGSFADWKAVAPEFRDDRFDTARRDHPGWSRKTRLRDDTGRNDFEAMKISRDSKYLSAYVRTCEPILKPQSSAGEWMTLLLNTDVNWKTGWSGFDLRVSGTRGEQSASVQAWRGGAWQKVGAAKSAVRGREMEISIPLSLLGGKVGREIDFKWADNTGFQSDALNWYEHGDAAPNGRFAYRYITR